MATLGDVAKVCKFVEQIEKNVGIHDDFILRFNTHLSNINDMVLEHFGLDTPLSIEAELPPQAEETFHKMNRWLTKQHYVFADYFQRQQFS